MHGIAIWAACDEVMAMPVATLGEYEDSYNERAARIGPQVTPRTPLSSSCENDRSSPRCPPMRGCP